MLGTTNAYASNQNTLHGDGLSALLQRGVEATTYSQSLLTLECQHRATTVVLSFGLADNNHHAPIFSMSFGHKAIVLLQTNTMIYPNTNFTQPKK